MPAGQVGGVAQPAGVGVEGARGSDDQAADVVPGEPGGLHRAVEGVGDLAYDGLGRAAAGGGQFVRADRAAGDVGDGGEDALGGDVETRRVGGARIDLVQLGAGARPALAGAGGQDESGGFQTGEEL